jgi:cytochrome c biogenesis protein CcdA
MVRAAGAPLVESSIFFGGSVVAAFVAGMIALFAPCCISVMLPAYFASSFQNRSVLVAMTFLFGAGIATVILPLVMGASLLRQLFVSQHIVVYALGGSIMLGMGLYTLLGGKLQLPLPGRRASGGTGPLSIYSLGVFSGVASSCCAPVLAGVIALSGVASSFGLALGLGAAYVFGMVAPLFVVALLWERYDWRSSRLFRGGTVRWRIGPVSRTLPVTMVASGTLLIIMGGATLWVAFAYDAMAPSSHWAAEFALRLQHYGQIVTTTLSWLPNWSAAAVLVLIAALLAWRALSQLGAGTMRRESDDHATPDKGRSAS